MILDAQLQFSAAQALTATAVSTNIVDLSSDRNIGIGTPLSVLVALDVGTDGTTGDETYTVTIQTDDNASFSSAATLVPAITIARSLAAGSRTIIAIPANADTERFMRLNYTLGGTTPTVTLSAWLVRTEDIDAVPTYPRGYTVS